ncbi:hypothetical protein PEL8287_02170 [Roseovarius litorisediminis]|uniref:Uncharacterized protein n=1 Tax=Roseovarius litorisediminis TaxID=1312363 RepID=A0A1Y5SLZ8_9RHOB|nr:hypothetical protein [Roseovarius litorisediminis]SLN43266.1 hypothetical protein PEL8287_02170 [Roseovarius litorisediminis]
MNGQFDEMTSKAKVIVKTAQVGNSDEPDIIDIEPEVEFEGAADSDPDNLFQTEDLQTYTKTARLYLRETW